jgi:hypothetical protein
MKWFHLEYTLYGVAAGLTAGLIVYLCTGCTTPGAYVPPVSISAGFFGAEVTVSEPGYTVPAKVVATASVGHPTLMVPAGDPVAASDSVPITTTIGNTATVPVLVAPVTSPVLAVPKP